jgi:cell division protein ZapA
MMPAPTGTVTISIMGREYQISCPPEEEEKLRKSARYLAQQMEQTKSRGGSLGFEKIAVITALNLAVELLETNQNATTSENASLQEIKQLEKKIDAALLASRQIEI